MSTDVWDYNKDTGQLKRWCEKKHVELQMIRKEKKKKERIENKMMNELECLNIFFPFFFFFLAFKNLLQFTGPFSLLHLLS